MKIIKNAKPPERKTTYSFDALKFGDAIDVKSYAGCKEMFRRWCIFNDRTDAKLLYAGKSPDDQMLHRFFYTKK